MGERGERGLMGGRIERCPVQILKRGKSGQCWTCQVSLGTHPRENRQVKQYLQPQPLQPPQPPNLPPEGSSEVYHRALGAIKPQHEPRR